MPTASRLPNLLQLIRRAGKKASPQPKKRHMGQPIPHVAHQQARAVDGGRNYATSSCNVGHRGTGAAQPPSYRTSPDCTAPTSPIAEAASDLFSRGWL